MSLYRLILIYMPGLSPVATVKVRIRLSFSDIRFYVSNIKNNTPVNIHPRNMSSGIEDMGTIDKKRLRLALSLYTILQILSIRLFEKPLILPAFLRHITANDSYTADKQLMLFDL